MKTLNLFAIVILFSSTAALSKESAEVIRPGEVRAMEIPLNHPDVKLTCKGGPVKFSRKDKKGIAIIIESYFSDLKPFTCELYEGGVLAHTYKFQVQDKAYKSEVLRVDMKRIKLSKKDQARANREQAMLNKIYASSVDDFLFSEPFRAPLNSFVTSVYGNRRLYNNNKRGQHLGTDFRAAIGDKVPSANRGKVVFSGDLFYTGGTVIIDHGLNVFTVYGHLSKPLAKTGSIVEAGELIGLSGNSGRTSGPHLHWGVKIQGQYIDGFSLIEETKKLYSK